MHFIVSLWLAIAAFTTVVEVPALEVHDGDRLTVVACSPNGAATITWAPYPSLGEWAVAFEEARSCQDGAGVRLADLSNVTCEVVDGATRCSGTIG